MKSGEARKLPGAGSAGGARQWRYKAYISYSHRDRAWGRWLHQALESYRVPGRLVGRPTAIGLVPAKIAPVFRDREELPTANDLGSAIYEALEASAALVVICSPAAASSRWVNEEILAFKRLGRADRIFCLIADGEPNASGTPDSELEECFPDALRHKVDAGGRLTDEREEPVAADARPGGDGRSGAKLKLIAGILGVGLDELRRREHQRRQRRLVGISMASLAGMLLMGVLALNAVVARKDAERNRDKAEELVGFMLGDLTAKLRAVGRLDVFDAIGDKALDYFETLTTKDLTKRTLAQRADALTLIGELAMDRANLDEAVRAFGQSVEQARVLANREPASPNWLGQLAESELWLGYAFWQQGKLTDALNHFRLALAAADRASTLAPEDIIALNLRVSAHNNIAQVLERRAELDEARREYEIVLALQQEVHRADPGNPDWQAEVGFAHNTLGKVELRLGSLDAARVHYSRDLDLKRTLVEADPEHRLWQRYLAMSESDMSDIAELSGESAAAVAHVERAMELSRRLVELEPENAIRTSLFARLQTRRGRLARMDGDLAMALELQLEARRVLESLVARDADSVIIRNSLAGARLALAETLAASGRQDAAVMEGRAALVVLESLAEADESDLVAQLELAKGELAVAGIFSSGGESEAARALFAGALERLDAAAGGTREPAVLHARTIALAGLGELEAARAFAELLLDKGYRQPDFLALAKRLEE